MPIRNQQQGARILVPACILDADDFGQYFSADDLQALFCMRAPPLRRALEYDKVRYATYRSRLLIGDPFGHSIVFSIFNHKIIDNSDNFY